MRLFETSRVIRSVLFAMMCLVGLRERVREGERTIRLLTLSHSLSHSLSISLSRALLAAVVNSFTFFSTAFVASNL